MKTKSLDETALSRLAYTGYLHGRICGCLPESSPLRERLASRYAAPRQSPVEPMGFLIGLRDAAGIIKSPAALLDVAHRVLDLAKAPPRRKRRPDTRWGSR